MAYLFTSESVSEGHPDKVADQISDALLDQFLAYDEHAHCAIESFCTTGQVVIMGEVRSTEYVDLQTIARKTIKNIGYTKSEYQFDGDSCGVLTAIHEQSDDINRGVSREEDENQGAGDQGMMFGYASNETKELMPATILYSHRIVEELARLRKSEPEKYGYLRPDSKSQVSMLYKDGKPVKVTTVVVSHQHSDDMDINVFTQVVKDVVKKVIPAEFLNDDIQYYVNPTGRFVIGGPNGDTGVTGRKIIVDTYGGVGSHGGGAFSGKDPSKVDRSAAYMCRYIAKNIVAAGLADKCEIQVAYAIGVAKPLSINVDTYGTGKIRNDADLEKVVEKVFDLRPAAILAKLDLKHPAKNGWAYRRTAAYGHFGRAGFPWEKTDMVDALKAAAAEYLK